MAELRKYMFDVDFGPPPEAPAPEIVEEEDEAIAEQEEPPPPTFSEEELNIARDTAYAEGRRQVADEGAEAAGRKIADMLAVIAGGMDDLVRRQADANAETMEAAVGIAMTAFRKMLPALSETDTFAEVARAVEEVIGHILDEPRIIVRVAAPLVEPLRDRLETVADAHGFEGRVLVQPDDRLAHGDCRVEWADGGAERNQERLMREIDLVIERGLTRPGRNDGTADTGGNEMTGTSGPAAPEGTA